MADFRKEQIDFDDDIIINGSLQTDNIKTDGNTIISTDANGNIILTPNGTGGIGNIATLTNLEFRIRQTAAEAIDQSQLTNNGSSGTGPTQYQTFTAGVTGFLTAIDAATSAAATGCYINIREGTGTTGALLATESGVNFPQFTPFTVNFSSPAFLYSGNVYTIEINGSNWFWYKNSNDVYVGGAFNLGGDGIFVTRMEAGYDFFIKQSDGNMGLFSDNIIINDGDISIIGSLDVDNINIDGNTIIATDANGDINLTPNGSGAVVIDNINIDGNTIISIDANGDINLSPNGSGTVVINTDLDVDNININGNTIISTDANGEIYILPNGTGSVRVGDGNITSNLGMLVLDGAVTSIEGPHIAAFVSGDNTYPVFQQANIAHDNVWQMFGAYWDGTNFRSGDTDSQFVIVKNSDFLEMFYGNEAAQGSIIAWNSGIRLTASDGGIRLYNTVIKPDQPSFFAYNSAERPDVTGDGTTYTLIFDTEVFDNGGVFDGTSTFIVSQTGFYLVCVNVELHDLNGQNRISVTLNQDGNLYKITYEALGAVAGVTGNWGGSKLLYLTASNTIIATVMTDGGAKVADVNDGQYVTNFSATLIN